MLSKNKIIEIIDASYLGEYKISVLFNDGVRKIIDFSEYILKCVKGDYRKYANPVNFKRFRIDNGNIVWGKNWDLIFPIEQLYAGKVNIA